MARLAAAFKDFLDDTLDLEGSLTDPRKEPRIPLATIAGSVHLLPLLGAKSLLDIDLHLRKDKLRRFFGGGVSDTHLIRVIGQLELDELRELNHRICFTDITPFRMQSGRGLKIGIVDGTTINRQLVCAFQLVRSEKERLVVDLEPQEKEGKELVAADALITRVLDSAGAGLPDIILGDGLYITQYHINRCLNHGVHALIKTKEEGTLNILLDAKAIFARSNLYRKDVEIVEGLDADRGVSYCIHASGGFSFEGVEKLLKVARIEDCDIKTGNIEVYYVVTTMDDLSAQEMRELSYLRWSIENHGFKMFNALCRSKHGYIKNEEVGLRLVFLLLHGFNSLLLFLTREWSKVRRRFAGAKLTIRFVTRTLIEELFSLPVHRKAYS